MAAKKYRGLGRIIRRRAAASRRGRGRPRLLRGGIFSFLKRKSRKPEDKPIEQMLADAMGKAMAEALSRIEEKKKEEVKSQTTGGAMELSLKKEKAEADQSKLATVSLGESEDKATLEAWKQDDLTKTDEQYPLVKRANKVYASARIRWNEKENTLLYDIIEPQIDESTKKLLRKIESMLIDRLEIEFTKLSKDKTEEYLMKKARELVSFYGIKMSPEQREIVEYYLFRDFIGLDRVEPIMEDSSIEDISCDGVGIPIYIYHRNPHYASLRTNIIFESTEELDSFVMKLAQRCGRAISVAEPLLDGSLPDGSRVQCTYGSDIARKGSSFTIRKFMREPLTPIDLLNYGSVDANILAYLWLAIEHGKSIILAGPTATGKTSLLNAISLFIPGDSKIVSIEDTAEIRLPHENWLPQVARGGFGTTDLSGKTLGEVSMFDLLRASLRQRPDYVIVGEVRGAEAAVLFQEMATGHPGLATIHADSVESLLNRLETQPINLPPSLLQNLDLMLILTREKVGGSYVRRIKEVVEVMGFDLKANAPMTNKVFGWIPSKDTFTYTEKSYILSIIMQERGATEQSIGDELRRRAALLKWLQKNGIRYYKDVNYYINKYNKSAEKVMEEIGAR